MASGDRFVDIYESTVDSGGPLVDLEGTVVAVVNSKAGDNLGFGVSAVLAGRVLTELLADGTYEYAYMGIRLRSVGPLLARANDVDRLETRPGDTISATVLRDGEERTELNCRLVEASPGRATVPAVDTLSRAVRQHPGRPADSRWPPATPPRRRP